MSDILHFTRPEAVGVSPEWVENYIRELNRRGKMCHSFLMMRHGKVFAEGYWKPFHKDWLHRMYSVSKSFVSVAIGFLADEGKITLDDKIVEYFPDKLPENPHPYIMEMTIRDMLKMATCHRYSTYYGSDMDWLATFFDPHRAPDHPAGTEFRYDTSASYTLDVLVERLTGKNFLEYLKDKYLRDIGFSEDAWCVEAPEGYAWGGSGVECTTRDLARFAMLLLYQGKLNGKQYLSREYVEEATSHQIDNIDGDGVDSLNGNGYGYQIWRVAHNAFACRGMGGQLAICIPDYDFLFVCTSDTQGDADSYGPLYDVLWDTVVKNITDDTLPEDDEALERLNLLIENLSVVLPTGELTSPMMEKVDGVPYTLSENKMGITGFTIDFRQKLLTLRTDRGEKPFPFGMGEYRDTVFPETHYSGRRINTPAQREYRCLNAGVWTSPDTFLLRTYVIDDYFGNMRMNFTFTDHKVALNITKTAEWFMDEYPGTAEGTVKIG